MFGQTWTHLVQRLNESILEHPLAGSHHPATGYYAPNIQEQLLDVDAQLREDIDTGIQHWQRHG